MKNFWRFSIYLAYIPLIAGCLGGGGGGESSAPADPLTSLPYTGLTSPAVFNSSDADEFILSTYYDNSYIFVLTDSATIPQQAAPQASITGVKSTLTEQGMCGGIAYYDLDMNENTGNFNGKVDFEGFNDCEAVITGTIVLTGQVNLVSLQFNSLVMKFDLLKFTDNTLGTLLLTGNFNIAQQEFTDTINFNLRARDNSSGKVYWYDNYKVKLVRGYDSQSYEDETISGRFYDPDRGYIDIYSVTPVRTYTGDEWSSSGVLMAKGAENATVRLTFLSTVLYRVEMDIDGDKVFEYDTGMVHYPGANTLPVVDAGVDTVGNVGCNVALDGSNSEDADFDTLQYTWTITVAPPGSMSQLTNSSTSKPLFTPDVKGEYQFSLSVSDGFDTVLDTLTLTSYGDLFCINDATVIPYAQSDQYEAGLAVGDVTSDGKADVLALTQEAELYVFTQNQSGGLNTPVMHTVDNWRAVKVGDVTGDGRNDAVVTTDAGVGILEQDDSGGLAAMVVYPFEPPITFAYSYSLALGDFDNNGRLDVAVLPQGGPVYVFLQQFDGTLGTSSTYETTTTGWSQVLAGDVTGDGRTDIVLSRADSYGSDNIGVLAQAATGGFATTVYYTIGTLPYTDTSRLVLGDLNGDSRLDLAYDLYEGTDENSTHIGVLPQSASGTFDTPVIYNAYYPPIYDMAVADVSGDGLNDLVVLHGTPHTGLPFSPTSVAVLAGTVAGSLAAYDAYPLSQTPQSWGGLALGDVDGDTSNDVVVTAHGCNEIFTCQPNLVVLHGMK